MLTPQNESRCTICGNEILSDSKFNCTCPERASDGSWQSPQEGWIEEFSNHYDRTFRLGAHCNVPLDKKEKQCSVLEHDNKVVIQEFIRTTIASELELYKKGLVEKVEEERIIVPYGNQPSIDGIRYNRAINDVIAIINNN